jgi:hypothetical protein
MWPAIHQINEHANADFLTRYVSVTIWMRNAIPPLIFDYLIMSSTEWVVYNIINLKMSLVTILLSLFLAIIANYFTLKHNNTMIAGKINGQMRKFLKWSIRY